MTLPSPSRETAGPDLSTFEGQKQHYAAIHARLYRSGNGSDDYQRRRAPLPLMRLSDRRQLPYAVSRPEQPPEPPEKRERFSNPVLRNPHIGKAPRWLEIARQVAAKHGLTVFDLEGDNRTRRYCAARHEAMWRMSTELGLSLASLAKKFGGRDHTTLMHGIRSHALIETAPRKRDLLMLCSGSASLMQPDELIAATAARHHITVAQLTGSQQSILISAARQELYWLLSTATKLGPVEIGALLNRNDSTVRIGIKKHKERMAQQ